MVITAVWIRFCRSWIGCAMCDYFFFNDTATTEIYTLSLHDALPISRNPRWGSAGCRFRLRGLAAMWRDRKSTRLNSSHLVISYAVFCLKKKTTRHSIPRHSGNNQLRYTPVTTTAAPGCESQPPTAHL